MRPSVRKLSLVFLAVAAMAIPAAADDPPVTTTRDAQGIWHIEGGSLYDVFEAMGYAVATDRLFQLDFTRRQGTGTLSEALGPDYVSTDVFLRTVGYSDDELEVQFAALSEDSQTAIQAYVDGINRRITEIQSDWHLMPYEYWIASFYYFVMENLGFNFLPEPWEINDVLRWMMLFQRGFDPEGMPNAATGQLGNLELFQTWAAVYPSDYLAMFSDVRWLNDPSALTMIPPETEAESVDGPQLPTISGDRYPDVSEATREIQSVVDTYRRQMEDLDILPKMGSYAWTISGEKTASGNPILYSGPQMGFSAPAVICEGSVRGGGFEVSGMHVPGIPGIAIGRTPHHAWSMQVGHAHTADFFLDPPQAVFLHRWETIDIAGADSITVPIFHTSHGPVINPLPFNPEDPPEFVVSWAYANRDHELRMVELLIDVARAQAIEDFDAAIEMGGVSMHTCYADRDGNIAYWMSGWDPVRAEGVDPRFPQMGDGTQEWTGERRPRAHDSNTAQGYYGGWNNKSQLDYGSGPNSTYYGPAHRAQVIDDYLSTHDNLTFEEVRDLALNIATTHSFMSGSGGGNTWAFVADDFTAAVAANPTDDRNAAIAMLEAWDGHYVAGGPEAWRFGPDAADAWVLQDAWIKEVLRLTFEDEFAASGFDWNQQSKDILFNVLIRALQGADAPLPTFYDWFQDKLNSGKPTTSDGIILLALDNVIADMGLGQYDQERGVITFGHQVLAGLLDPILGSNFGEMHTIPFSARSTYAQVVEFGEDGPIRIESMFPMGESGQCSFNGTFFPDLDENFATMCPVYDPFMPRPFPVFD